MSITHLAESFEDHFLTRELLGLPTVIGADEVLERVGVIDDAEATGERDSARAR